MGDRIKRLWFVFKPDVYPLFKKIFGTIFQGGRQGFEVKYFRARNTGKQTSNY